MQKNSGKFRNEMQSMNRSLTQNKAKVTDAKSSKKNWVYQKAGKWADASGHYLTAH